MPALRRRSFAIGFLFAVLALVGSVASQQQPPQRPGQSPYGPTPTELPRIPPPNPQAATVPQGFSVEVFAANLTYPTSIEFDDRGGIYVAEAGYNYGDEVAPARILYYTSSGSPPEIVASQLSGPVTDILWRNGQLYISHRGKISVMQPGRGVRDLVTGLPSLGDHHNNSLAAGPDGKIYFGQGTATNSGVVGLDNFKHGWLQKYPEFHDIPARDIRLRGQTFQAPDPIALLTAQEQRTVETSAFQPFGRTADMVRGQTKANGTILRMNPDGSGLEVYAWGLRNPFGLGFTPDGRLFATDAGYDERGVRPIANAPDCLWEVRQGGWYGFPDFVAGIPVTDERFRPRNGPAPEFLLAEHPPVEKPVLTLPPHTSGTKFDLSRGGAFGAGQVYLAMTGDMTPMTGEATEHPGYGVARVDLNTLQITPFFRTRPEALGPRGLEYVATAGPKRPVDVKFSPDGNSLFVVDIGAMALVPTAIGPMPRPFPGSGVIWRISAAGAPRLSGAAAASPGTRWQAARPPMSSPAPARVFPMQPGVPVYRSYRSTFIHPDCRIVW